MTVKISLEAYQRLQDIAEQILSGTSLSEDIRIKCSEAIRWIDEQKHEAELCVNHIAAAREQTDSDLQIDDHPVVCQADDGVWVNAWIYVSNFNPDEDEYQ